MVTTDKGKIGIIVICLGLVCSTGSFLYLDSSDPMEWVMTKEGQAGIMIAILSFWLVPYNQYLCFFGKKIMPHS